LKLKRSCAYLFTVICLIALLIPVTSAAESASDQIMSWGIDVTFGDGTIDVEFGITGNGTMNKLGCESIYVYKKNGTEWDDYTYRTEYNTGMSVYNHFTYANMIEIPCNDSAEYKVVVTVFAEDDEARDSRTDVFYL